MIRAIMERAAGETSESCSRNGPLPKISAPRAARAPTYSGHTRIRRCVVTIGVAIIVDGDAFVVCLLLETSN